MGPGAKAGLDPTTSGCAQLSAASPPDVGGSRPHATDVAYTVVAYSRVMQISWKAFGEKQKVQSQKLEVMRRKSMAESLEV